MPKERRQRLLGHPTSAKAPTHLAIQDTDLHTEEPVDARAGPPGHDGSAPPPLPPLPHAPRSGLKKKEKQGLKRELFLQRLEASRSPYSKSHNRRLKRLEREQIAGGLGGLRSALAAVEQDVARADPRAQAPVAPGAKNADPAPAAEPDRPQPPARPGQIGEGKGAPLKRAQRKRALQAERLRQPLILSNPDFAANPFETIRTHARNTLVQRPSV